MHETVPRKTAMLPRRTRALIHVRQVAHVQSSTATRTICSAGFMTIGIAFTRLAEHTDFIADAVIFLSGKRIALAERGHTSPTPAQRGRTLFPFPAASPQGESVMKKLLLIAATTLVSLAAVQPAFAYDHHNCHKVRVHHHWETRCHH